MSKESTGHRPPSPPHSDHGDGDMGIAKLEHFHEPYTPPKTVRPASRAEDLMSNYSSPSPYPPLHHQTYYTQQPTFVRQMQYRTPPVGSEPGIMTRSGRKLGSPIEQDNHYDRRSRSPKLKRSRATKPGKRGVPVVSQPLSVLTRDYKIPVRDMGAWVNRSVEERMQEVEKKKGYISRPMNSFMLYRSAYAERVKQFCRENNHQVVSQVTGQSWPLEPPHIKEMYEQYAIIERDNHAAAHPNYKFAPNKSKRKRARDDDDSDSDDDWEGPGVAKQSRAGRRDQTRSLSSTPFDPDQTDRFAIPLCQPPQPHPSSYQAANPNGPPPFTFGPGGLSHGYYQPQTVPYGQHVDDIRFGRVDNPLPPYDAGSQLIGMPDSHGGDLLGLTAGPNANKPAEQLLDPRLGQHDLDYRYGQYEGTPQQSYHIPRSYDYGLYQPSSDTAYGDGTLHPGMATLTEGWTQPSEPGSDFDHEFRHWG